MTRRVLSPLFTLLVAAVCFPGCAQFFREFEIHFDDPQWQERTYADLTRADTLLMVQAVIEQHRLRPERVDSYAGELDTYWYYEYDSDRNLDLRGRVRAEVEMAEAGGVILRLRVQREYNRDIGRHIDPSQGNWDAYDDDVSMAGILLRKVDILVQSTSEASSAS